MSTIRAYINGATAGKKLYLAVYEKDNWLKKPVFSIIAISRRNPSLVEFNIVGGEYAIAVMEDIFDDGEIIRNFWNVPQNPLGISRNPDLGEKPDFMKCMFTLHEDVIFEMNINLVRVG
jgi:uncharacterized protein (DUF2141 family)